MHWLVQGTGAKVLITDGDFPASTARGKDSNLVHLNLAPGLLSCTDVLRVLVRTIPIEAMAVMLPPEGTERPPVWEEYAKILQTSLSIKSPEEYERFSFYEKVKSDDVALVIQTGETREYANVLLTIGSRW